MSSPCPSPVKRKTPVKRDGSTKLLGMTDTELKALCYGSICTSEKIKVCSSKSDKEWQFLNISQVDYDKLAAMLKITRKSASNQYTAARNRLNKIIKEETGMDPDDLIDDAASPTKKAKVTKPRATRAPKNPKKTTKASKAKTEPEVKVDTELETDTQDAKSEETEVPDPLNLLYDEDADYVA